MRAHPFLGFFSLFLPLLSAASGCGGDGGDGGTGGTPGTGGAGGGGQAVPCDSAPADLALAGTWVASARLTVTLAGVPGGAITICPEGQEGESSMLLLVTLEQPGPTELSQVKATLCSIELPVVTALVGTCDPMSGGLVSTQIIAPQTLLTALPSVPAEVVGGALAGTQSGAAVTFDRFTVTVGSTEKGASMPSWDTAAPACGATDVGRTTQCETTCVSDCAALRDDDGDGYPGVTVHVCGTTPDDVRKGALCQPEAPNEPGATLQGRGFIDMEVNPQLGGSAVSSCEVEGFVDSAVLYNLVGADLYLAGAQISVTSAIKSLPSFQVDPAESRFRMVRIDGQHGAPDWGVNPADTAGACATILGRMNEL
jgi:hypothetical protein